MHTTVGERRDIPVEARLYESVTNGAELRRRLAARDLDAAFIDADMVIDIFPVLIAAHQAVESGTLGVGEAVMAAVDASSARTGTLTAHSVHAQLLLCLSGGKSLSSALRRFGVGELTTRVLVVVLPPTVVSGRGAAAAAATAATTTITTPTATATNSDTDAVTDTAAGAAAEGGTTVPPLTPATAPTALATAAAAGSAGAGASPPPLVVSGTSPTAGPAFDDGVAGVEVEDVAAGLAAGAASRAVVTAAAYKVSAEELAAGGRGGGVSALVDAIATRVATREVAAK
ncbi:hypothetical protein MMPV_007379 [Pyropia vietnamensis]